jgi:hypothetical protein
MATRQNRRRVVILISILAWIWLISAFSSGLPDLLGSSPINGLFTIIGGFFSYFATQGTARMIGRWMGLGREGADRITFKTFHDSCWVERADETFAKPAAAAHGMGGWLLVFILVVAVASPLAILIFTASDVKSMAITYPELPRLAQWSTYVSVYWAVAVFSSMLLCFTGYRLWANRVADSIIFAKLILWICWPLCSLVVLEFTCVIFKLPPANMLSLGSAKMAVLNLIAAVVWTCYLTISARVKNTYDHTLGLSGKELVEPVR